MSTNVKRFALISLLLLVSNTLIASGFYFTCDTPKATIEYYDENNVYQPAGTLPWFAIRQKYSYLIVRVSAPGYETFEKGFENSSDTLEGNTFNIKLVPEDANFEGRAMMGFAGQVVSRRAKKIYANNFKILICNLTTYKKGDGQTSRVISDVQNDGWYSGALVNFATNKAAKLGDRIAYMVFDSQLSRCYGVKVHVVNQDDLDNTAVILNVLIM